MVLNGGIVLLGLVLLCLGGDALVRGASRLAGSFGVSPLVIGLTVVALGTSSPELLVNISASFSGKNDLALGNVVGSNIANIGFILGVSGIITPVAVAAVLIRREIPVTIGAAAALLALAWDGELSRLDGAILLAVLLIFNAILYYMETRPVVQNDPALEDFVEIGVEAVQPHNRLLEAARVVAGIALLVAGAQLMVDGSTKIARDLGVSELVIGVTLVAVGTSLPELATSLVAAFHRQTDILVGNVLGSNIYNILAILSVTTLIRPIPVPDTLLALQLPVMLLFSIALLPFARDYTLWRWEAALLTGGYVAFIVWTFAA